MRVSALLMMVIAATIAAGGVIPPAGGQNTPEETPLTIITTVDRATINLGDVFTYTLTIQAKPGVQVTLPGWGANLGQFEIRDYRTSEKKNPDGSTTSTSVYSLAIYDTGTFPIPPVTVQYKAPGDAEAHSLSSDSVSITVASLAPSEAKDIRGLKPQAEIPPNYRLLYLIGGLSILAILATVGIILAIRRHRRRQAAPTPEYSGPPHEVALKELEQLLASGLLREGRVREFYFELSEIIRRYLGRRFQIYTLERTTEEITGQLDKLYLSEQGFGLITMFLADTDLVKFARYVPPSGEIERDVDRARQIIEVTKPVASSADGASGSNGAPSSPPAGPAESCDETPVAAAIPGVTSPSPPSPRPVPPELPITRSAES